MIRRSADVTIKENGDLVWAGHDLGPGAGAHIGGSSEYEYWRRVPAAHLTALLTALGGGPDDDVADLVKRRFASDVQLAEFAAEHGITTTFSSWSSSFGDDERSLAPSFVRLSFALRGALCGDDQAAPSATRLGAGAQTSPYGFGSPLLYLAHISMRGPAETRPIVPLAKIASSASVRGDRPALDRRDDDRPRVQGRREPDEDLVRGDQAQLVLDRAIDDDLGLLAWLARTSADDGRAPVEVADVRDEELVVRVELRTHVVRASWRAVRR